MTQESLQRIEAKLEKVDDRIYRQTALLQGLVQRVSAAEVRISRLETDIKPLKVHDDMWSGAAKVLAVIVAVVGIAGSIFGIWAMFRR